MKGRAWMIQLVEGFPIPPIFREELVKDGSFRFQAKVNRASSHGGPLRGRLKLRRLKVDGAAPIRSRTKEDPLGATRKFFR